jgi:UDP-N-acetylmuramoyl-L-alanyl-D-glutamate-L-lysine ligase
LTLPDHIGPIEHPTFEDYFYCKRQLLHNSKAIILNEEADYFNMIQEESIESTQEVYVYGRSENCDLYYVVDENDHLAFKVGTGNGNRLVQLAGDYHINLAGDFNKGNTLAAAISTFLVGATGEDARQGANNTTVPGRMEMLKQSNGSTIYVDYAHNRASISALLDEVRNAHTGKITVVIGSTGDKAQSRRKDFGEVLSVKADHVILTEDDPNFEAVEKIAQEIIEARIQDFSYEVIVNRKEAIQKALSLATNKDDVVVLAGKGADLYMIVKGEKIAYQGDYSIAEEFLN